MAAPSPAPESRSALEAREASLLRYWLILRKRRATVGFFAAIVLAAVLVFTAISSKTYEAAATLEITPESTSAINVEEVTDMLSVTSGEERRMFYNTQFRVMQSRKVLGLAVERLHAEHHAGEILEHDDPIEFLRKNLTIDPELDTRLVHVRFRYTERRDRSVAVRADPQTPDFAATPPGADAPSATGPAPDAEPPAAEVATGATPGAPTAPARPGSTGCGGCAGCASGDDASLVVPEAAERAALFANVIAQAYIDVNRQRSLDAANEALSWLDGQKQDFEEKSRETRKQVHEFKYGKDEQGDVVGLDEQAATVRKSLERLQESWSETHARRVEVESGYERARTLLAGGQWIGLARFLSGRDPTLQNLLQSWQDLEKDRAAKGARYLPEHPEMQRLDAQLGELEAQIRAQVDQNLQGQRAELDLLVTQEEALTAELEQVKARISELDEMYLDLGAKEVAAERSAAFYRDLDQRAAEVQLLTSVPLQQFIEKNNIWLVDPAIPEPEPVKPQWGENLLMALLVGLLGGVGLAFFMEYIDNTVKTREDVEEVVGVQFLGAVPALGVQDLTAIQDDVDRSIFVVARPRSPVAESLRSVRTNILFQTEGRNRHIRADGRPQTRLLVTSAAPREGKSFVTSNLAAIIAMTGSRVLLIDADLRRPTQHKLYRLPSDRGLSNALIEDTEPQTCILRTHVPDLDLMPVGPRPPNPAELLGSERFTRMLSQLDEYDVVIIDSSPITAVADPLIVARHVDGVVLIIESNRTARELVIQSHDRLKEMDARILGAIVNKLDIKRAGYGYYYYYDYHTVYYYGEGDGKSGRKQA